MSKFWIGVCGLAVVGLAVVLIASRSGNRELDSVSLNSDDQSKASTSRKTVKPASLLENLKLTDQDMKEVGGVLRPKRDVDFEKTKPVAVPSKKSVLPYSGRVPRVPKDATAATKLLHEELSKGADTPAAARSALFLPEKFDEEEFRKDPEGWITKVRPGRVFQPAQPGPDVEPIATESPAFQNLLQGESIVLKIKAQPGSPVSVYTPQAGEFAGTRLTTATRIADEEGNAEFTYQATSGTAGIVDIIAASPLNSEQLQFRVNVELPTVAAGNK